MYNTIRIKDGIFAFLDKTMKKYCFAFLLVFVTYYAWMYRSGNDVAMANLTTAQIQTLAASVKADEVVMYTTTTCRYCHAAKQWLAHYGFAFTECNMSVERRCEAEFMRYGANGTPFLVIRRGGNEHHMKDGFDSNEFLAVLQE